MTKPWIQSFTGQAIDFVEPDLTNFSIVDVAHSLSHICRYTGHSRLHYSVAEHSVHCSYMAEPGDELEALMHDAVESIVGDVAKPLKVLLPAYQVIEDRMDRAVRKRFGLLPHIPPPVKMVDVRMLATEAPQAMGEPPKSWGLESITPFDLKLKYWSPFIAKHKFLDRYKELTC